MKRLCLSDSLRFAAVCPSWRVASQECSQQPTPFLPWIVQSTAPPRPEKMHTYYSPSEDRAYNVLNMIRNENIDATPSVKYCSSSFDGWLIISKYAEDKRVSDYFFNPMTGAWIMLPPFPLNDQFFVKTVASSDPRCSDCIVAAITSDNQLFFCRSTDTSWRYNCTLAFDIGDLQFDEDERLYLSVIVSGILDAIYRFEPRKVLFEGANYVSHDSCIKGKLRHSLAVKRMRPPSLIKSSKGELLVVRNQLVKMNENQHIVPFLSSKLKPAKSSYDSKLEEIDGLGDEIIFLGDKEGGVSIPILNLREREKALLGGGNQIVYMSGEDHKIVVYSLADRTFQCHSASGFKVLESCKQLWFTPNMSTFS